MLRPPTQAHIVGSNDVGKLSGRERSFVGKVSSFARESSLSISFTVDSISSLNRAYTSRESFTVAENDVLESASSFKKEVTN